MKKLLLITPLVILLCFTFGCQKQVEEGIPEEEAKAIGDVYVHEVFPDLHATIDETIIKGDKIIWVWSFTATNTGPFHTPLGDVPATGKKVQFSGVATEKTEKEKANRIVREIWK